MAKQKIITIPFKIPANVAANVRRDFTKKLNDNPLFKKCRGFGVAFSSYGSYYPEAVPFKVTLEPIGGKPLIDPVHYKFLEISSNVQPDGRLFTVDFDVDGNDVVLGIITNQITQGEISGEAVFLLTEN